MRKSKVMVSVKEVGRDDSAKVIWPVDKAAEYLEIDKGQVLGNLNRNDGAFVFDHKYEVVRISEFKRRKGTKIVRVSDHKEWDSIAACAKEIGAKPSEMETAIRVDQKFEFNGELYFAPNYVQKHKTPSKTRRSRIKVESLNGKANLGSIKPSHPEERKPTTTEIIEQGEHTISQIITDIDTAKQCIQLMQKLAKERVDAFEYDKVHKIIDALQLIHEV